MFITFLCKTPSALSAGNIRFLMARLSVLGLLLSPPAFAGITQADVVPASQPAYACTRNCPPGDEKCLQACTNLNTPKQQQPSPPNFQCLNQCTRAGYAFAYCKKLCSP
jgi:hypothetical protein